MLLFIKYEKHNSKGYFSCFCLIFVVNVFFSPYWARFTWLWFKFFISVGNNCDSLLSHSFYRF